MKKNLFQLFLLLFCALFLSFNGILHPLLHHHGGEAASGGPRLCTAVHLAWNPAEDSFCPLCSGILTGVPDSSALPSKIVFLVSFLMFFPMEHPLFTGDPLHLSRAPPSSFPA